MAAVFSHSEVNFPLITPYWQVCISCSPSFQPSTAPVDHFSVMALLTCLFTDSSLHRRASLLWWLLHESRFIHRTLVYYWQGLRWALMWSQRSPFKLPPRLSLSALPCFLAQQARDSVLVWFPCSAGVPLTESDSSREALSSSTMESAGPCLGVATSQLAVSPPLPLPLPQRPRVCPDTPIPFDPTHQITSHNK